MEAAFQTLAVRFHLNVTSGVLTKVSMQGISSQTRPLHRVLPCSYSSESIRLSPGLIAETRAIVLIVKPVGFLATTNSCSLNAKHSS
jgi:hypothetical protein